MESEGMFVSAQFEERKLNTIDYMNEQRKL